MSDLYAVIGNPIAQSKSPIIHSLFAEACGQAIQYERIESPLDAFAQTVETFRRRGGRGVNVTAPFKLEAFAYATRVSTAARIAGAANAMKFIGEEVHAENFDGVGLVRDIVVNMQTPIRGKRVLFLGAGGATRGALQPFLAEAPTEIVVANRDALKTAALIDEVARGQNVASATYASLANQRFDLVINATSASLTNAAPPVPISAFAHTALACELAYGKGLTPFLRLAREGGAHRLADGVGMLVEQAAEAFAWWRGVRPNTQLVIAAMSVPLE